jgi:hypothetical protein
MTRKGEITRSRLRREWPHHVMLSADKVRGLENNEIVRMSASPWGRRAHTRFRLSVYFCAEQERAGQVQR